MVSHAAVYRDRYVPTASANVIDGREDVASFVETCVDVVGADASDCSTMTVP